MYRPSRYLTSHMLCLYKSKIRLKKKYCCHIWAWAAQSTLSTFIVYCYFISWEFDRRAFSWCFIRRKIWWNVEYRIFSYSNVHITLSSTRDLTFILANWNWKNHGICLNNLHYLRFILIFNNSSHKTQFFEIIIKSLHNTNFSHISRRPRIKELLF